MAFGRWDTTKNGFIFSSADLLAECLTACSIISGPIVFLSPFYLLDEANGAVLQIVGEFLVCAGVSCWAVSVDSRQEVGSWITSHSVQPSAMLQPVTDLQPCKLERVLQNENKRKFCYFLLHSSK